MKRGIHVLYYLVLIFGQDIKEFNTLSSLVSVYGYMRSTLKTGTRGKVFTG